MSGVNAAAIAGLLFRKAERRREQESAAGLRDARQGLSSHRMYYGHIIDPLKKTVVDEVFLVLMQAPRSYTREDVVEIHSHAGPAVLRRILELVLRHGARLADPGEFTRRAFLNGRLDLSQAEAVIDIINARTESALETASRQLQGAIGQAVENIRQSLLEIIARIEAETEFGDETGQLVEPKVLAVKIGQEVIRPLKQMIQDYEYGHLVRDGLRVVVVGRPNVGKSSLMNRMLKKERAIVTALPGTTRDSIEESLSIQGIPVVIADTAGLHSTVEPVEVLGIKKTHEYIDSADLILFLIAADEGFKPEDEEIFRQIEKRHVILVINKIDLLGQGRQARLPEFLRGCVQTEISAKYDRGIETLKETIVQFVLKDRAVKIPSRLIPNLRHKLAFEGCLTEIEAATRELEEGLTLEMVAERLKNAFQKLGDVIGQNADDTVLERIFSQFCIGK
jgi:tRNA modification GTPase